MTDTNLARLSYVRESTVGTTPSIASTTVMREVRLTGEGLNFEINNTVSNEIRSDRMVADLIQVGAQNNGPLNFEQSFPLYRTYHDDFIAAALYASWTNTPTKHNIVADTEVANVGAGTGVYTIDAGGASFNVAGLLVECSGFTNSANNGLFKVTSATATAITTNNSSSVAETAPPIGAMIKVVGYEAGSGDFSTNVTGGNNLASAANVLASLGLAVGMMIKIGAGSGSNAFATAACNTWGRITSVAAASIALTNVNSGFGVDNGSSKTIRIWFGDYIKNGTTEQSFTVEKAFLGMGTPAYMVYTGCHVAQWALDMQAGNIITGSYGLLGFSHSTSAASLGSPYAASTEYIFAASNNVGRLAEAGSSIITGNNIAQRVSFALNNNNRPKTGVGTLGLTGVGVGRCDVSGTLECYFDDKAIYDKYVAGTETSLNTRMYAANPITTSGKRAMTVEIPNMEFESAPIPVSGPNAEVMVTLGWRAKKDNATSAHIIINRLPYYVD